eukprot:TRINITY_DN72264_c0_g1_i1.p1 TRINITY_DN72264_c0_g1~~TRINITY_DN72264_c0_g1_i1.p1  ORF type:complete len:1152 (-),score=267.71 TRINITY_DN72264_c0_g1_i1:121-3576(-)
MPLASSYRLSAKESAPAQSTAEQRRRANAGRTSSSWRPPVVTVSSPLGGAVASPSPQPTPDAAKASTAKPRSASAGREIVRHEPLAVSLQPAKDVRPFRCLSDAALAREVDVLQNALLDLKGDWSKRLAALKRLQGLVLGSAHLQNFQEQIYRLQDVLLSQVQDLRSALCREACSVLYSLAQTMGPELEQLAVVALPALFRLTAVSIQVIAESGHQCIVAIVQQSLTPRVLATLLEQADSKSRQQRLRAAQAVHAALRLDALSIWKSQVDALEAHLHSLLEDAQADVRAEARQCFWSFRQLFPDRAAKFYKRLEYAKQRLLEAERAIGGDKTEADGEDAGGGLDDEAQGSRAQSRSASPTPVQTPQKRTRDDRKPSFAELAVTPDPPPSAQTRPLGARASTSSLKGGSRPASPLQTRSAAATPKKSPTKVAQSPPQGAEPAGATSRLRRPVRGSVAQPSVSAASTPKVRRGSVPKARPSRAAPGKVAEAASAGLGGHEDKLLQRGVNPWASKLAAKHSIDQRHPEGKPSRASTAYEAASGLTDASEGALADLARDPLDEDACAGEAYARLCSQARASKAEIGRLAALESLAQIVVTGGPEAQTAAQDLVLGTVANALQDCSPCAAAGACVLRAWLERSTQPCSECSSRGLVAALLNGLCAEDKGLDMDCNDLKACLQLLVRKEGPAAFLATLFAVAFSTKMPSEHAVPAHRELVLIACLQVMQTHLLEMPEVCDYFAGRDGNVDRDGVVAFDNAKQPTPMSHFIVELLNCTDSASKIEDTSSVEALSGDSTASGRLRRVVGHTLHGLYLRETDAFLFSAAFLPQQSREDLGRKLSLLVPDFGDCLEAVRRELSVKASSDSEDAVAEDTSAGNDLQSQDASATASECDDSALSGDPSSVDAGGDGAAVEKPASMPTLLQSVGQGGAPTLLTSCDGKTRRLMTLRNLTAAVRTESMEAWENHFRQALLVVLKSLGEKDDEAGLREAAMVCLQEFVTKMPEAVCPFAEAVSAKLWEQFGGASASDKKRIADAEKTLERLLGVVEPPRGLEIILPTLQSENAFLLQASLRLLHLVVQRMARVEAARRLEVIVRDVVMVFSHCLPEVRKAAVHCLVNIYLLLGDEAIRVYGKELTGAQLKLVCIYIAKRAETSLAG